MVVPGKTATHPLVSFAIAAARIQTHFGSLQRHERGYALAPRINPDHNLIFVVRGVVVWVVDEIEFELSPGSLLVVPPGHPHSGFSLKKRITLGSIHIDAKLPGGQDVFEFLGIPLLRQLTTGSFLQRYLHASLDEYDRDDPAQTQTMVAGWSAMILPELIRHDAALGLLKPKEADPLVAATLERLQAAIEHPLRLADLSAWSGFSGQYLNRVFSRVVGVTPLRYLTQIRMEKAAELLVEDTLTVAAVGRRVCFADPYHFSRVFKAHHRFSPEQYRRLTRFAAP